MILIFLAALAPAAESSNSAVLWMDFEMAAEGSPAAPLLRHEHLALAPGEGAHGSVGLRAEYVGYDRGSERIVSNIALREAGLEFSLNYDVRFEPDFQLKSTFGSAKVLPSAGLRSYAVSGWTQKLQTSPLQGLSGLASLTSSTRQ